MSKIQVWRAFIALVLILGLASVKPASALGTPRITGVNPGSGSPVGSNVCVRAEVDWDSDFRSMRIKFAQEGWNESAEINFERCFGTSNYGPGWYKIRVEVAKVGEDWGSATWTEADYELTAQQQQQPEPQQQPQSPSIFCSVDSFNVWPQTATVGEDINITGSGSCNVGIRAIKVKIDGGDLYEIGSTSLSTIWHTGGSSAGSHKIKIFVAGQGDNNWDSPATQVINIQLNSPSQNNPAPATRNPNDYFHNGDLIKTNSDGRVYVIIKEGSAIQRRWIPNPETLDALGMAQSNVDNKGFNERELLKLGQGSDVPDVNRDPDGFRTFKATFFPNLAPIVPGQPNQNSQPEHLNPDTQLAPPQGPQGTVGNCPASPTMVEPGDTAIVTGFSQKELRIRNGPSTSNKIIGGIPKYERFTIIAGPICADDIRWYEVGYGGVDGWSAEVAFDGEYNMVPNDYLIQGQTSPTENLQPNVPEPNQVIQVGPGPLSKIPASCQKLAEENQTTGEKIMEFIASIAGDRFSVSADEQCTNFVNRSISEIESCWGKNHYPSGGYYDDWARDPNKSGSCGWTVSPSTSSQLADFSNAQPGDIITWDPASDNGNVRCAGADYDNGHVAVYQGTNPDGTIRVTESNWERDHNKVPVDPNCMNIIHLPSNSGQSATVQAQQQPTDKCSQYAWWNPRGWWCRAFGK